jgi:hypothetical protein
VNKNLTNIIDALSLGLFHRAQQEAKQDTLYHLYIRITLYSGQVIRIDKNESVHVKVGGESTPFASVTPINNIPHGLTLQQFIDKTIEKVGKKRFYVYEAFSTNCQQFVYDLLSANNLLTPKEEQFIGLQAQKLGDRLPSYIPSIANSLTDTAGIAGLISGGAIVPSTPGNDSSTVLMSYSNGHGTNYTVNGPMTADQIRQTQAYYEKLGYQGGLTAAGQKVLGTQGSTTVVVPFGTGPIQLQPTHIYYGQTDQYGRPIMGTVMPSSYNAINTLRSVAGVFNQYVNDGYVQ